ncbi:hypothetical protein HOY82DRAFT_605107 [Tuber indicum]|nr:hypothetical protein HOY82DRAFT_605107 [Tuber indicum]
MMEELKNLGEIISVGGAEEYTIEQVAPEAVAMNVKKEVQAGVTAMTLAVEEAMPKEVHAVNEALVREIRIQRYHDGSASSGPVLMLGVEPLFLRTCEVMNMPSATHPSPTSSMTESSTVISAGIVSSYVGIIRAIFEEYQRLTDFLQAPKRAVIDSATKLPATTTSIPSSAFPAAPKDYVVKRYAGHLERALESTAGRAEGIEDVLDIEGPRKELTYFRLKSTDT